MIRKWHTEHGQELHVKPKFLTKAKAYLSATFGPIIPDFFYVCLHWVFQVCASDKDKILCKKNSSKLNECLYPGHKGGPRRTNKALKSPKITRSLKAPQDVSF